MPISLGQALRSWSRTNMQATVVTVVNLIRRFLKDHKAAAREASRGKSCNPSVATNGSAFPGSLSTKRHYFPCKSQ